MAIGSGSEGAQTALQEQYKEDLSLADAEVLALSTLKQVMEEKVRPGGAVRVRVQGWGMGSVGQQVPGQEKGPSGGGQGCSRASATGPDGGTQAPCVHEAAASSRRFPVGAEGVCRVDACLQPEHA
jgi:hypothetical protein